jgi:dipeptidyl aminopeptidase/acylaminoacyl peptidase
MTLCNQTKRDAQAISGAWRGILLVMLYMVALASFPAMGFGKNKVQYEKYSWKYMKLPHFNLYFYQNQGSLPAISAQWVENDYDALSADFEFKFKTSIPVIVYGSTGAFERTNVIPDLLPEGVGGFTTRIKNRIVVPFDGSYEELRHVLHHELVHGFQNSIMYDGIGSALLSGAETNMPLWLAEGMAEYLSSGWNAEADMFLMDAAIFGSIPPPGPELDGYMAYKGGQSFLYYIASTRGKDLFSTFLKQFGKIKNIDRAFKDVYGKTSEEMGEDWLFQLKRIYWPEIGKRQEPLKNGRALTAHTKDRDFFNLKPRISPDGAKVAYFSDLRDFTRIIIANRSGKILQEISQAGFAGNFESFHPFRSGMCWSPDGNKIAFVTFYHGQDELRIIDVKRKKFLTTVRPRLSGMGSPDWSPDGKSVVWTGVDKDFSDLYLYSLESGSVKRLTNTITMESDPRFSRDGKNIVFGMQDTSGEALREKNVKSRPGTDLYSLDLATGTVSRLTHGPGNNKSPCFSPDGSSILYVSDRNGLDNLYIAPYSSPDSCRPLTDVLGGCSSPDWSKDSSSVVYCLFQKGGWDIWTINDPMKKLMGAGLSPTKWAAGLADTSVHFFETPPPSAGPEKKSSDTLDHKRKRPVRAFGDAPFFGAPSALDAHDGISETDTIDSAMAARPAKKDPLAKTTGDSIASIAKKDSSENDKKKPFKASKTVLNFDSVSTRPYRLKFSPDILLIGAGVNPYYGSGYAGQWLGVFSDLMGDHQITVAGDIDGNLADYTHIFASYVNQRHKINLGAALFYNREYATRTIFLDSLFFDTDAGGMLFASYPFSMFSRLELNMVYQNIFRVPYVSSDGYTIEKDTAAPSVTYNIFTPTLSYSYDDILWGITGPLNGTRTQSTIMFSPPVAHINDAFLSFDFDFRRYFHLWKRFVWANKIAFGASVPLGGQEISARRFFMGGSENWLTYATNIEGYKANVNRFFYSEIVVPFRGWNYLDLIGSKFMVLNTEFRFPFIREFSIAWPLPIALRYINGAVFTDIGNAWDKKDELKNVPLPKKLYGGVGYGLRANLGIFVVRYDRAWRTDWGTYLDNPISYWSLGAEF